MVLNDAINHEAILLPLTVNDDGGFSYLETASKGIYCFNQGEGSGGVNWAHSHATARLQLGREKGKKG